LTWAVPRIANAVTWPVADTAVLLCSCCRIRSTYFCRVKSALEALTPLAAAPVPMTIPPWQNDALEQAYRIISGVANRRESKSQDG
jgi:hypothetical protein